VLVENKVKKKVDIRSN